MQVGVQEEGDGTRWRALHPPVGCQLPSGPGRGMDPPSACPGPDRREQLQGGAWRGGQRAWVLMRRPLTGTSFLQP